PFRHFPLGASPQGFVRLACLIHAANVRSEPGSNPSKKAASGTCPVQTDSPGTRPGSSGRKSALKELEVALRHDSKNSREQLASFPARMCHAVRRYTPSLWLGPTELSKTSLRATPPVPSTVQRTAREQGQPKHVTPLLPGG